MITSLLFLELEPTLKLGADTIDMLCHVNQRIDWMNHACGLCQKFPVATNHWVAVFQQVRVIVEKSMIDATPGFAKAPE
ncbi:hypothetical protein IQ266_25145 [filamentous cyanobacterium LEGE 11480]|uniref:Uncharacterized protein n=1 Tax=Romeriopsis navalis LEGE 11480 TaxID=2777977 RepID=A0A928VSN7_9CYAN|nr:hypothetical protein [Romeriopsis navalis]MBE9033027.1 hypothetical protein [Romeriopsis navalis LEGE 11480]